MTTMTPETGRRSELTPSEMFLTLNGFDEIAIAQRFGVDVSEMTKTPGMFVRALIFVSERRDGVKDGEAFKAAMEMPFGTAQEYFEPEPEDDESEEGDDESESGKGDEPSS